MKTGFISVLLFVVLFPPVGGAASGDMALIPSGAFLMGSADGEADERPLHRVHLDAFYMDRYLVTNEAYARFLNVLGNRAEGGKKWLDMDGPLSSWLCKIQRKDGRFEAKPGYENHPVIKVTWYGALAYARWLGKRLPTEAEWERAARGLLEGQRFVFGDRLTPARANIEGLHAATPVGSYPPNPFGLYDLTASVWQWCSDWYEPDYYSRSLSRNPKGPDNGTQKVLRGGSWFHKDSWRVAVRGADEPTSHHFCFVTGFRCARD